MNDRFKFRIPMFTDKGSFMEFQYIELGDEIECTLCGYNGEPQQSTGLKDKNGKLIYEGDIISCQGKAVIAYSDDKALFYAHYFNTVGICEWYLFELKKIFAQCEAIGNIYENKELLCQK